MKIIFTLIFLILPTSLLSETIVIECGKDISWRIESDGTVLDKRKEYDYEWRVHDNLFLANKNETQIVIGIKKPKGKINRLLFSLPERTIGDIFTAFGYSSTSDHEQNIDIGFCTYSKF